jgi:sulfide:quinone oxidoreductase
VVPTPRIFGIPAIAETLEKVISDYGIHLHTNAEVTAVDAGARKAVVTAVNPDGSDLMLPYDVLHMVPRQSAPDWIKASPLSTGDEYGYVEVDKHTLQHVRYPNIFALGIPRPVRLSGSRRRSWSPISTTSSRTDRPVRRTTGTPPAR